ncbi:MAG: glycosyltransferase [Patescibacteria group bacterium]|nr:glycosyltransferase [Patescibacteria group bacterium]
MPAENATTLSYIITTKNKLPYLKESMGRLLQHVKEGEEIIVADAESTDSTKEFLNDLKRSGKIEYFVSEPDFGESHGLNKLLLVARGTLIKIITDDDVFHYPAIEACKKFMLSETQVDMVSTEGGFKNQNITTGVRPLVYEQNYRQWQKDHTPFSFCGLGIMIRRSSLPLLGLWNPSFRRADAEFSLRVTAGKANIAWYTGYSFVNISNPQSVSLVYMKKIKDETDRLNKFYLNKNPDSFIVEKLKVLRNKIRSGSFGKKPSSTTFQAQWPKLSADALKWLEEMNTTGNPEFLWNK